MLRFKYKENDTILVIMVTPKTSENPINANINASDSSQFKIPTTGVHTPAKITISKEAQIEFVEKSRAEQVHLAELNKLLASAKDDADKEYMATEINKLVAALFYEVKNFKSGFDQENQNELKSILSAVNEDMESTASQIGLEIETKKIPNASSKHIESLLAEESTASLYSIAIKNMHEEIRRFAKDELKVDPDEFMIRFVEFEKRMNENRRILRGMMRSDPNVIQNTSEINIPQYSV